MIDITRCKKCQTNTADLNAKTEGYWKRPGRKRVPVKEMKWI